MSYLGPLRAHFAGRFLASPSTVNNDPTHYDNATFQPGFQQPGQSGGWNPDGNANWRLVGCTVRSAWHADGAPAAAGDAVLGARVIDNPDGFPPKIVDLDPMQQLVSAVWGLRVRVLDDEENLLLGGDFDAAGCFDLWDRAGAADGDNAAGAAYQSVLTDLTWGETSRSAVLDELRETSDRCLSVKFNVDGFDLTPRPGSATFMTGRITGTIGPYAEGEPRHFVAGRQLRARGVSDMQDIFTPTGQINFATALVHSGRRRIYLDLGNALPTDGPGGAPDPALGAVALICQPGPDASGKVLPPIPLGDVPYGDADWLDRTSGVVELPAGRELTADEMTAVATNPLALTATTGTPGTTTIAVAEDVDGLDVRADQFVFRLDPGETAGVTLHATRFGQPYAGATVLCFRDPLQLQGTQFATLAIQSATSIPAGTPEHAIEFPARVSADDHGVARLEIRANDPGMPRGSIDGQVFGVRPALEETLAVGRNYVFNQSHFVSLLVWSRFQPDDPPTWHGSIRDVFVQYANLYPVAATYIDLADYATVVAHREDICHYLARPLDAPDSMPITRDMSRSKREAILTWLECSRPAADRSPPRQGAAPEQGSARGAAPAGEAPDPSRTQGKAGAARRRFVGRHQPKERE